MKDIDGDSFYRCLLRCLRGRFHDSGDREDDDTVDNAITSSSFPTILQRSSSLSSLSSNASMFPVIVRAGWWMFCTLGTVDVDISAAHIV